MKAAVLIVAVTLALLVAGCAGDPGAEASDDCATRVRADGVVYTSSGYTERSATRHSSAEEADCADVGRDAAGSVFPDSPRRVRTWASASYPPSRVLGVRAGDTGSLAVFVADSVPPEERDRIYQDLGGGPRRTGPE